MDIRSFFKSPKATTTKAATTPSKNDTNNVTSPKKEEGDNKKDEVPQIKIDEVQKEDKATPQSPGRTPSSPGKSPAKAKRKIHDINMNFSDALAALTIPDAPNLSAGEFEGKFEEVAQFLLNHCIFYINEIPHRFVEVEFYYCGYNHLDTFAHNGDQQLTRGEWYFHKTGNRYRDGNYKGIDVTFGDGTAYGGILIRSVAMLEAPYTLKCGPSLTVDHILALTKQKDIPSFVQAFGVTAVKNEGEAKKALYIKKTSDMKVLPIIKSIRVGLSMKRYQAEREFYFGKTYRYLTQPTKVTKGKHFMVVGMHMQKSNRADIATITGVAPKSVARYVEAFDAGTKQDFKKFIGLQELGVEEECTLLGACSVSPVPPNKKGTTTTTKTESNSDIKEDEKEKEKTEKQTDKKEKEFEKKNEAEEEKRGTKRKEQSEEDDEEVETKRTKIDEDHEDDDEAVKMLDKVESEKREAEDDADVLQALEAVEEGKKKDKKEEKGENEEKDKDKKGEKSGEDTEEDEDAIRLLEQAEKAKEEKEKEKKTGKGKKAAAKKKK